MRAGTQPLGATLAWSTEGPIKPVITDLPGKIRIKRRQGQFAKIYFRTSEGVREFPINDCGDHWEPALDCDRGSNYRPK